MENPMLQCSFEFLGYGGRDKSTYFNFHNHQAYELIYYLKGSGSATINGTKYEYLPDTYTITQPTHMHDEYHSEETYVIYIVFAYKGNLVNLTDGIFYDNTGNNVMQILEDMKKEFYAQSSYFKLKLDLLVEQLIIELARTLENQRSPNNLARAINYINENYNEKINLNLLAEKSGYSYNHFRRLIKNHTGLSPINYIIMQRIENAKHLLKCTSLPILHISQECGFSSESQFCCMFKKAVQQTPKAYRKTLSS